MSLVALALFVLACGWNVYRDFLPTRTVALRVEGHPQHFGAVLSAGYVLVIALALHETFVVSQSYLALISSVSGWMPESIEKETVAKIYLGQLTTFQVMLAISFWSGLLALLLPKLMNIPLALSTRQRILVSWSRLDEVEQLLIDVSVSDVHLCVTLENGKVYIGIPLEADVGAQRAAWIQMLPVASGYRTKQGRLRLRLIYLETYEALKEAAAGSITKEDFQVVIPLAKVVSLQKFDLHFYANHFIKNDEQENSETSNAEPEISQEALAPSKELSERLSDRFVVAMLWVYLVSLTGIFLSFPFIPWMVPWFLVFAAFAALIVWEREPLGSVT